MVTLEGHGVSEVVRDASILISDPDPGPLAAAIDELVADEELRRSLGDRGSALASGLTWSNSTLAFIEVLRGMVA